MLKQHLFIKHMHIYFQANISTKEIAK